jgi:hypothetical protein
MKTIIYKLLNEISQLLGKILSTSYDKSANLYDILINLLYYTKRQFENIYYDYCIKPKLEKEFEDEKKVKNIIMVLILISHSNYKNKQLKLITYPVEQKL